MTGWTLDLARQWVAPVRVRWRRWALAGASGAAFLVSVLGEADTRCSADDPAVCGPDLVFSVAFVLAIGTVVLLWWRPYVAAGCALAFAAVDLAYDDVWTANVAWPFVAVLHVAHVVALRRDAAQQRALAARAMTPLPSRATSVPPRGSGAGPVGPFPVGAVLLAVVAFGCLGMLLRAQASDRAHVARSEVVHGTVAEVSDDGAVIGIRLDHGPLATPQLVELEPLDAYDVGDDVLVRVDPTDPGWSHLVAEPPDRTWWASLAFGAALLALLLAERLVTARVRRGALLAHPPTHGVPVRCVVDDADVALLSCVDRDVVFADLDVVVSEERAGPPPWEDDRLGDGLEPAHLVGDVRHGGWCAVVTAAGTTLPEGPLQAIGELPGIQDLEDDLDDEPAADPREWTEPVPANVVPAPLPVRLAPGALERLLWMGAALAATAFALWLLDPEVGGWFRSLFVVLFGVEAAYWGVSRAMESVTVDRAAVTVTSALRRVLMPIAEIEEVRCSQTHVLVLFGDDESLELGPFGGGSVGRHRLDPRPVPRDDGPTAAQVGAAIDDARVAAGSVDATPQAGPPLRWGGVGPGVPWLVLAALVLVGRYVGVYVL